MREKLFYRDATSDDDATYQAILDPDPDPRHAVIRDDLEAIWSKFRDLASDHWWDEFPRDGKTNQRFWEMYLAASLRDGGMTLAPLPDDAPDVRVDLPDGTPVWIEAIAAENSLPDNPNAVPSIPESPPMVPVVSDFPEVQIMLRLTNALDTKFKQRERRLARTNPRVPIRETDPYVIALNGSALPRIMAGTTPPLIVRSVFGVGHLKLMLDSKTGKVVDHEWDARYHIEKKPVSEGASQPPPIATTFFATPIHAGISAIIFSTAKAGWHDWSEIPGIRKKQELGSCFTIVRNPYATAPIPVDFFPRGEVWDSTVNGDFINITKVR